ncbi:MAG: helix-turn-helix domain-containing protein [Acidobacteriia bacterium]|nr:helix-turn-helix domain-containing protein [Terriglobia bacterium]
MPFLVSDQLRARSRTPEAGQGKDRHDDSVIRKQERAKQALLDMLRQAREEAGVLQADLARQLGRKQGFVSKYELGGRRLDLLDLADICDALGISFTDFAKRFDEKRRGR